MVTTIDRQSGLSSAVSRKGPCVVAATTNITLSGEQTVDGVAVTDGMRVLLTGQTDATENGIYYVSTGEWSRAADFSRNDDVMEGTEVRVTRGTNDGIWVVTTTGTIVIGTTSLTLALDTSLTGGSLLAANNLSDVSVKPTANTNLQGTAVTIASAATVDLSDPAVNTGAFTTISGATGISAFTMNAEQSAMVRFSGAPLITVGANLVGTNGGSNMQMEAGDIAYLKRVGTVVYFAHFPVRDRNNSKWAAAVASAGTITLPEGKYGHITGSTAITDVDFTLAVDGKWAIVEFDGAPLITHSSTLKCPGSTNYQIAAGDVGMFIQDVGDTVRFVPLSSPRAETIMISVGADTTVITTGTAKRTFRMPFAMTVTAVRSSLVTAAAAGLVTVDINEGGSSILSTKLSIDATEKTSTTAATPAVISDATLADDAEITIDIDAVTGAVAAGLKVTLIGYRS
jgi:hypothetical protein